MKKYKNIALFLLFIAILIISGAKLEESKPEIVKFYFPQKGVYIVDINAGECPDCIRTYFSGSLETVESAAEKTGAIAAINAGFFDPSNGLTTSYIVKYGKLVGDPALNRHLMNNPDLQKYLPQILNRSEFRILNCGLTKAFEIKQHNLPARQGCGIIDSVGAGPELLPDLKLADEAFVVEENGKIIKQSAGALGKYARSAIAIKDGHILFVAVSNSNPMTLKELANFLKRIGADQAMAFDGGSSTSLYIKMPGQKKFVLTSAKNNAARRVKSMMIVKIPNSQ